MDLLPHPTHPLVAVIFLSTPLALLNFHNLRLHTISGHLDFSTIGTSEVGATSYMCSRYTDILDLFTFMYFHRRLYDAKIVWCFACVCVDLNFLIFFLFFPPLT